MNGNNFRLYNFAECRQIDELSQRAGLSERQLMGQAALASYYALQLHLEKKNQALQRKERILILCGPGNNGGDGLALAYLLLTSPQLNPFPEIHIFHSSGQVKSTAARFYWDLLEKEKFPIRNPQEFLKEKLRGSDLVVEALLGTGQSSRVRGVILEMLLHIRERFCETRSHSYPYLLSLDLPAGLSEKDPADFVAKGFSPSLKKGEQETYYFAAPDEIHCYGADKLALRLSAPLCAHSNIQILPIGFLAGPDISFGRPRLWHFPELYKGESKSYKTLFRKQASGHKYRAGHALLVGGSRGMEGAVLMAARSFFAAGGGILHVLLPQSRPPSGPILSKALPTAIFYDEKSMDMKIRPHCILIGPGLKPKDLEEMGDTIRRFVEQNYSQSYFILDAAAAKLIHKPGLFFPLRRSIVLAHSGEWKALGGAVIKDTESLYAAMDFYEKKVGPQSHALIKDSISFLFSMAQERQEKENRMEGLLFAKPNASLSVAGSGDNLAGILLALFARKEKFSPYTSLDRFWRKENIGEEERKEDEEREEFQNKVLLGIQLLHQALEGRIHPRSDEFASLIESLLY